MIESGIRTFYLADTSIANMIGTKFHWGRVPQSTVAPYIRATLIDDRTWFITNDATTSAYDRLIQLSIFGVGYDTTASIRDAVLNRTASVTPSSIPQVSVIRHDGTRSFDDPSGVGLNHIAIDLRVFFKA